MKTYLINERKIKTSVIKISALKTDGLIKLIHVLVISSILAFSTNTIASTFSQADIKQLLVEEAHYQDISPSLVLAIAKVESDFNPSALSHAGAKGVMQIMPATAKNVFQVEGHELYNAKVNIRIGVAFIKQLIETYDGKVDIALSHYNGGSRVKRPDGALRVIPATSNYVNKVKMHAQGYKNEGYDDVSTLAERNTAQYQKNNQRLTLSYAQQMALDELDYNDMARQSVASLMQQKIDKPTHRINQLQDLRVHNLTRSFASQTLTVEKKITTTGPLDSSLNAAEPIFIPSKQSVIRGPKQSYTSHTNDTTAKAKVQVSAMPTYSDPTIEQVDYASSYNAKPASAPSYHVSANMPLGNKQQRVSSWEAIFN